MDDSLRERNGFELSNLEQFALSVECRGPYPFTEEQIIGNIAVMDAVTQSVNTGKAVAIAK